MATTKTLYYVVRVNQDSRDTFAATDLQEAIDAAQPDDGDFLQYCTRWSTDAGAARLVGHSPRRWHRCYVGNVNEVA